MRAICRDSLKVDAIKMRLSALIEDGGLEGGDATLKKKSSEKDQGR